MCVICMTRNNIFGVGQRKVKDDEHYNHFWKFPLHCKLVYDNDYYQCILGVFNKMCCEVLIPSEHEKFMKGDISVEEKCVLEFCLAKILVESRCSILVLEQSILVNWSNTECWIMDNKNTSAILNWCKRAIEYHLSLVCHSKQYNCWCNIDG